MNQNVALDTLVERRDFILDVNRMMEEKAAVHKLNEEVLVHLLDLLEEASHVHGNLYWLSLARINELAIICAGNYADNCEFGLVGDLLVNPRKILIHIRGHSQPIVKERYTLLTEQFSHTAATRGGVVEWLITHTIVEIGTQAILPHLLERLKNSGLFRESYLAAIESREKRVASLFAYLACQQFENQTAFTKWLQNASTEDQSLMKSKLCRFEFSLFGLLGEDIARTANDFNYESNFLKGH